MNNPGPSDDKTADALKSQRFHMLEEIARELGHGDVTFPTCFDAAMKVRDALRRPDLALDQMARAVSLDPLISAKLLRMANSVMYNIERREIKDLKHAISLLGVNLVRTTSLAVAMDQLLRSKDLAVFEELATFFWNHSVMTAAAARVLAREFTRIDPDEAMLAGLVHDLGAFYLLYRAAQDPELRARPETVKYLIVQWHESIGESLLHALGLPKSIVEAMRDHDHPRPPAEALRTLSDVVFVANLLAGGSFEWHRQDFEQELVRPELEDERYRNLMEQINADTEELRATFG
jgi:HD-like signal output (HDOD) protein